MPEAKQRASERRRASLPVAAATAPPKTARRGREPDEQTMERLRRERNGLRDELASSSAARDEAIAQVGAVQLKLGKAFSSQGDDAALAEAKRRIQVLTETVGLCEQHISRACATTAPAAPTQPAVRGAPTGRGTTRSATSATA